MRHAPVEPLERRRLLAATVTGSVFMDTNGDAFFSQTETQYGVPRSRVYIDANSNGRLDSGETAVETDARGRYRLEDVPFGRHRIRVEPPSGEGWRVLGNNVQYFIVADDSPRHFEPFRIQYTRGVWETVGQDAQHTGVSPFASQPLQDVQWNSATDVTTPETAGATYGAPVITRYGNLMIPLSFPDGRYAVQAISGYDRHVLWTIFSDYTVPAGQQGSFSVALSPDNRLYFPGRGGRINVMSFPDYPRTAGAGADTAYTFYGANRYTQATSAQYNNSVFVNTPLVFDDRGNVFFGYRAVGPTPLNLHGGLARITNRGVGAHSDNFRTLRNPSATLTNTYIPSGVAPAVGTSGSAVYYALNTPSGSTLVRASGLSAKANRVVALTVGDTPVTLPATSAASPAVGPDGDVYLAVPPQTSGPNAGRGALLHFSPNLKAKTPGAVGSDATVSIVPASAVPAYGGRSPYLVLAKYNELSPTNGRPNRVVLLDPRADTTDPVSGTPVMAEVLSQASPIPAQVWNFTSAAIDTRSPSALVTNSGGGLYRWNLVDNTFSEVLVFDPADPTTTSTSAIVVGLDGSVYTTREGALYAAGYNFSGGVPI